ncbi:MAG: hypothetical protein JOZ72_02170 [Alphaproteobacteria bacterium]|nr:hypothetical protein [Alphaproteobacteria bacterium]
MDEFDMLLLSFAPTPLGLDWPVTPVPELFGAVSGVPVLLGPEFCMAPVPVLDPLLEPLVCAKLGAASATIAAKLTKASFMVVFSYAVE